MLVLFLIDLFTTVTDTTLSDFFETAKTRPVFGFMQVPQCPHCQATFVNWTTLKNLYGNDDSIILADFDCEEDNFACKSVLEVSGFPTLFVMFKGETHPVFIERSIESFIAEVEFIRTVDPNLPCAPWFRQLGPYPLFGFSFTEDARPACQRLTALARQVPHSEGRFFLGPRSDNFTLTVALSEIYSTDYEGPDETSAIAAYARDYVHLSLNDWPLEEVDLITQRRSGFFIYATERQLGAAKLFAMLQSERYCFGLMPFATFNETYTNSGIEEADLPLIAVLNRNRTQFSIVQSLRYDNETHEFFEQMANETEDPDAIFEFLRPWETTSEQPASQQVETEEEGDGENKVDLL
jgi:hypothetical protein